MASEQLKNHLKGNCLGRRNAATYQELAQTFHISEKELQRQVNRLRKNQVPICGGQDGMFYARNAGELYDTIQNLKVMAAGLEQVIASLEGALENFGEVQDGAAGPDS